MNTQHTNDFTEIMTGRRSIRQYDTSVKISKEEMEQILAEATLAPSSINLQPWRFVVIDSEEGKATLAPLASFNQKQVQTSSAMIAIFGDLQSFENAEEILGTAVERGYMPVEAKERQMEMINGVAATITKEAMKDVVLVDGGLVAMQLMLVARAHGYDTCPIGGYDKANIAEAFGLDKERYVPVMLVSIGKADDAGYTSVRLPVEKVAQWK
ncbi:nitroreductase family protein [Priestia taiwanensis]|uniref:NAD(P)H nitroreductase n=1 Tax=Priestia taiwanensis TaxID=1347902 RepID=A0A917AT24_9BACI|nr:nitroreductase family protein [Priestia taiwanensis]MBM7364054.1 nitroreductase [Priestia taiwanensis]GGE71239.1 NAD(P)H nitroreductase [Priestia taiwanensis]